MREWPITPPLICVQSALTHTWHHICGAATLSTLSALWKIVTSLCCSLTLGLEMTVLCCWKGLCGSVPAGQVFLRVCWFSFGLWSLINDKEWDKPDKWLESDGLTAIPLHLRPLALFWRLLFVYGHGVHLICSVLDRHSRYGLQFQLCCYYSELYWNSESGRDQWLSIIFG